MLVKKRIYWIINSNKFYLPEDTSLLPSLKNTTNGETLDMGPEDINKENIFRRLSCLDTNKATRPDIIHPFVNELIS